MYDIAIVGGGPAGMTAALYAQRNGKSALVIEKEGFGGQITHSPKVENYPGTISMSGNEFADKMLDQILAQGAEIAIETVCAVENTEEYKTVKTEEGSEYRARAVIIATGVKHRMLGLEGEEELVGEGISFCAVCDGDFYAGKSVIVAGGGNSALQEAVLLSAKCAKVTVLQDLPYYTGEKKLCEVLFSKSNVEGITGVRITKIISENGEFKGVGTRRADSGEEEEIYADGLFVAIGLIPENEPFKNVAGLDERGYFASGEDCLTNNPGIYVAGDCRAKQIRQITTASADGAVAALAACRYIDETAK